MKKNTLIESRTTVVDIIEYVRRKIYLFSKNTIEEEEEEDTTAELEKNNKVPNNYETVEKSVLVN